VRKVGGTSKLSAGCRDGELRAVSCVDQPVRASISAEVDIGACVEAATEVEGVATRQGRDGAPLLESRIA